MTLILLFQNVYLYSILALFLTIYGPRLHMRLPNSVMKLFNNIVFRACILAVPKGQWEGALALNFSKRKRMQRIIIPQIYPIILPNNFNYLIL